MMRKYSSNFYLNRKSEALASAEEIVPIILEYINPKSVIDVGCGTGEWLSVFRNNGVDRIFGVDGTSVGDESMAIPKDKFQRQDLNEPIVFKDEFDLALSVEVAEHLPKERADRFVNSLTNLAPVVAFSAAIPYQGGTHHLNEQWQSYWADLFAKYGFTAVDCLRKKIWKNDKVAFWYAQNLIVYVKKAELPRYKRLQSYVADGVQDQLDLVHPLNYLRKTDPSVTSLSFASSLILKLPRLMMRDLRMKMMRVPGHFRHRKGWLDGTTEGEK